MIAEKMREYLDNQRTSFRDTVDQLLVEEAQDLFVESFKKYLHDEERDSAGKIYMSASGYCARKNAYQYHGFKPKGRAIDARSRLNFFMGDMVELAVVLLAYKAGVGLTKFGKDQDRITIDVAGVEISGRPDGIITQNARTVLLEVKSMSTYGYKMFEKGDISYEYLAQVNACMEATGINEAIILGVCKDTGVFSERLVAKDPNIVMANKLGYLQVAQSTPEKLPEPDSRFDANKKTGLYPWQCTYCAYHQLCRSKAKKVVVKGAYQLQEVI